MAEHAAPEYAAAPGNDYTSHEGTYEAFVHMAFIGTIHVINTVIGLAIGGVVHNWWVAIPIIFILAPFALIQGIMSGSRTSSYIALVISAVALLLTAA
jgi:hypothetical protein